MRCTVRSEPENAPRKSAAGALTGGIAVLRTAGGGAGGTVVHSADPTEIQHFALTPLIGSAVTASQAISCKMRFSFFEFSSPGFSKEVSPTGLR